MLGQVNKFFKLCSNKEDFFFFCSLAQTFFIIFFFSLCKSSQLLFFGMITACGLDTLKVFETTFSMYEELMLKTYLGTCGFRCFLKMELQQSGKSLLRLNNDTTSLPDTGLPENY